MAQRTFINNDFTNMKTFLETLVPDYFTSVTLSDNSIVCKGTEQHTLLTILKRSSSWIIYVYSEAGGSVSFATTRTLPYAYRCSKGVMIPFTSLNSAIIIAKTNRDATAIIMPTVDNDTSYCTSLACVAQDDALPAELLSFPQQSIRSQTLLVPFPTNNVIGLPSYTTDVYYLMFTQFPPGQVWDLVIGGRKYLSNGYYAILDQ